MRRDKEREYEREKAYKGKKKWWNKSQALCVLLGVAVVSESLMDMTHPDNIQEQAGYPKAPITLADQHQSMTTSTSWYLNRLRMGFYHGDSNSIQHIFPVIQLFFFRPFLCFVFYFIFQLVSHWCVCACVSVCCMWWLSHLLN